MLKESLSEGEKGRRASPPLFRYVRLDSILISALAILRSNSKVTKRKQCRVELLLSLCRPPFDLSAHLVFQN